MEKRTGDDLEQVVSIDDLTFDPKNVRPHSARNLKHVASSLREVGAARSIVLDEHNRVVAGEGTVRGARDAGITRVRVIEADGDELIAVRRSNWSEKQKRRAALHDNFRPPEDDDVDVEGLRALHDDGVDLGDGLWTAEERAEMFADTVEKEPGDTVEEITVERPQEVAWLLVAIPLEKWPDVQDAVAQLTHADVAVLSTMVMRPKKEPTA